MVQNDGKKRQNRHGSVQSLEILRLKKEMNNQQNELSMESPERQPLRKRTDRCPPSPLMTPAWRESMES